MTKIEEKPVSDLLNLSGKSAIVTGGAMGLGYAIARRLAEAGAQVLMTDVDLEALEKAAKVLSDKGHKVKAQKANVGVEKEIESMVKSAVENFGGVDILVNNAGIYPVSAVIDMSAKEWDEVLDVNLKGTFLCCREAGRQMVAQNRGGVIINVSSMDAIRPSMIGLAHYDASKGGMHSFTRSLALELGPNNIRVISIAPGAIWTEGTRVNALKSGGVVDLEAFFKAIEAKIPLGYMGHSDDIARVVLFLASESSSYITGTTIVVDGGALCYY